VLLPDKFNYTLPAHCENFTTVEIIISDTVAVLTNIDKEETDTGDQKHLASYCRRELMIKVINVKKLLFYNNV